MREIELVVAQRELGERGVALGAHPRDDGGDRVVDVGRLLALLRKQRLEAVLEIGISGVKPHGHGERVLRAACRPGSLPAPGSSPGCSGLERVRHSGPRSLSSASMHSTSSWMEASPEKVSVTWPDGGSHRLEADGQQRQDPLARSRLHVLELGAEHAVESERRAPPPEILAVAPASPPSPNRSG